MSDDACTFEGFLPSQSLSHLLCFAKMCMYTCPLNSFGLIRLLCPFNNRNHW